MKKVLYILPHVSTGGLPQYTYAMISKITSDVDVYCVEYEYSSPEFVVQRNKIKSLLGNKFYSVSSNKHVILDIIKSITPDIIHFQEMPEYFMDVSIANHIYDSNRTYTIVETSHDSSFNANNKIYYPDHFALISEYQKSEFSKLGIPITLVEYDIEYIDRASDRDAALLSLGLDPKLKHIVSVGLWTSRKNQSEAVEYARSLQSHPIQFHFIGNLADNFASYWKPLMENLPPNVKVWGERSDVDIFYSCMDLFLFTSRGTDNDKETSPLVIREAIGHGIPSLIYNLPVYMGMYDTYDTIQYLNFDNLKHNESLILQSVGLDSKSTSIIRTLNGDVDFGKIDFPNSMLETEQLYGEAATVYWGTYVHKELERNGLTIQSGDVFVDFGANIGVSSHYALTHGASKVYCFEPDPILCDIVRTNNPNNSIVFNYAIAPTESEIELYHWPYNEVNVGPTYTVKSISLSSALRMVSENIIDYLKIDIEGFEEHLFDDAPRVLFNRIRKMFIEYHKPDVDVFAAKLRGHGFVVTIEYGRHQSYLYCQNIHLLSFGKYDVDAKYDPSANKIIFSSKSPISDCTISIRDIDSKSVIWSSHYDTLIPNTEYWMIPVPKSFINFDTDPNFGGMTIEFYSGSTIVYSTDIRIKTPTVHKPVTKLFNIKEPVFMNYNEFFVDKIYDKYFHGKKFNTVVDVGANIGMWIEYIQTVADVTNVYALEPNTSALASLRNSFGKTIKIIDKALTPTDGEVTFHVDTANSLVSSINDYGNIFNSSYTVGATSFKTFLRDNAIDYIDLMKVDIETGEYDLFETMDSSDLAKIGNLLIEYHLFGEITIDNVASLVNKLQSNGFVCDVVKIHDTGGFIHATRSAIEPVGYLLDVAKKCVSIAAHPVNQYRRDMLDSRIAFYKERGYDIILTCTELIDKIDGVDHYIILGDNLADTYNFMPSLQDGEIHRYFDTQTHRYTTTEYGLDYNIFPIMLSVIPNFAKSLGYQFIVMTDVDFCIDDDCYDKTVGSISSVSDVYFYKSEGSSTDVDEFCASFFYGGVDVLAFVLNIDKVWRYNNTKSFSSIEHFLTAMFGSGSGFGLGTVGGYIYNPDKLSKLFPNIIVNALSTQNTAKIYRNPDGSRYNFMAYKGCVDNNSFGFALVDCSSRINNIVIEDTLHQVGSYIEIPLKPNTDYQLYMYDANQRNASTYIPISNRYVLTTIDGIPKNIMHTVEDTQPKKVKAVHLLLTDGDTNQETSIESISTYATNNSIEYVQNINDRFTEYPPAHNAIRPHDVSDSEYQNNKLGSGHYGCYTSFRNAILNEFDSGTDYFMIFEGDAFITDVDKFTSALQSILPLMDSMEIGYVSMGGPVDLLHGVLQSTVIKDINSDFYTCDKIIGCQCIIFPQWFRVQLQDMLRNEPWDVSDIYFNHTFGKHGVTMAVSKNVLVTQLDGVSAIDNEYKDYKKFNGLLE